jgi:DNA-binding transcriptional MerR regulator
MERTALRVGEVAVRAGVHRETLRYYERRGLIPPPPRRISGYRAYPAETVERVRLIKWAQGLGFTLREIVELSRIPRDPSGGERNMCVPARSRRSTRSTKRSPGSSS